MPGLPMEPGSDKWNTIGSTMVTRKTALSIPEELLAEVDRAAEQRGESRSGYITQVLRRAVRARRDAEITRRLNEMFADDETREEQSRTAEAMDSVGSDWSEERW
jgi:metal-responsive CopG/Arc/MetJ family transcriptional regulator